MDIFGDIYTGVLNLVLYLTVFAKGGSIITLIGIFFLYKGLAEKFTQRSDEEEYEQFGQNTQ